ncbi:MAG: pilus assembly protein PilM [Kiritimatiellales bacterium]|nr:pilus assembly protein PilM [Kiritimatiellales bacterium]MCF7864070.1 pilus assembly protein PilM [Kiritimatiellales bacterium]
MPAESIEKNENVAGINIADGIVSVSRMVRRGRKKILLTHAGWMEYAPDATDDEVVQVIRKLWKKCRMPTRTVSVGLQSRSLCLKYFKFPDLSQGELASALKLEAEETLQLPPEQIMLDWHLNRPDNDPYTQQGEQLQGVLVAVAKHQVERQLNLVKKAGLYPVVMDVGCTALCNLYLALRGESVNTENAVCVVNLSRYNADISILYNHHYIYPRTIISRSAEWSTKVQYLVENISDALLYYHVKVDKTPVTRLILTGFVPDDPHFVGHIHDTIGLPTEVWNPLRDESFMVAQSVKSDCSTPLMTTSLGLGLRNT